jgi:hypothetical protein
MVAMGLGGFIMKIVVTAFALIVAFGTAAQAADCKSVADAQARLSCFDKAPVGEKSHGAKAKVAAAPAEDFTAVKAVIGRKLKDPMSAQWAELFKVKTKDGEFVCVAP